MAFSATIPVGSPNTYRVPSLELNGQVHQIPINFQDGDHTYKSPEFDLGVVHSLQGRGLKAQLTFHYTYDSKTRVITVCGTDYPSVEGMALITFPHGIDQISVERAATTSGFAGDEQKLSDAWNPRSQLTPGAAKIMRDIARAANDALIEALAARSPIYRRTCTTS